MTRPWFTSEWNEADHCPGPTPVCLRCWGVLVLLPRLWHWACWCRVAGYWMDREYKTHLRPLRGRLSIAWTVWRARYWADWTTPGGGSE